MRIFTMNFEPDPFLSKVNQDLRSRGLLAGTSTREQFISLHREAWTRRSEAIGAGSSGESAVDLETVLRTIDRVFVVPQAQQEILAYVCQLNRLTAAVVSTIESGAVVLYPRTPHLPWEIVFHQHVRRAGFRSYILNGTDLVQRITIARGDDLVHPEYVVASASDHAGRNHDRELVDVSNRVASGLLAPRPKGERVAWELGQRVPKVVRARLSYSWRRKNLSRSYYSIFSNQQLRSSLHDWRRARRAMLGELLSRPKVNLSEPMALVGLHYQPERTTDPEGGLFARQIEFVSRIRQELDDCDMKGLALLVREHPRYRVEHVPALNEVHYLEARVNLYREIERIPGVRLIGWDDDLSDLLRNARVVGSVQGSITWEALLHGTPAITARRTWHSVCGASVTLAGSNEVGAELRRSMALSRSEVKQAVQDFVRTECITWRGSIGGQSQLAANESLVRDMAADLLEAVSGDLARA